MDVQKIYLECELRYKNKKIKFNRTNLLRKINNAEQQARSNYQKLSLPRICSLRAYTGVWINEKIGNDIAKKSVGKSFKMDNPLDEYKASADLINNFPKDLIKEIKNKYSDKLDQIDYSLIRKKWIAAIIERNNFSLNKGFKSRLDMHLNNFMIPKSEYSKFLKNVDKIIDFCNQHITLDPSKFSEWESSKVCFICYIKEFPLKNISDLINIFEKKYPILKKYKNKIKIRLDNKSNTKYVKEKDYFDITLNKKVSLNHQLMDLIHELSHVISMLKVFKKDDYLYFLGTYYWEKSAINIELNFINKNFPELFTAELGNILQIIHQILFEIEIYQHPNQNPDRLFAKCFNRCFKGANQKNNKTYLLNLDVLYNNFHQLPYVVGYTNILNKFYA